MAKNKENVKTITITIKGEEWNTILDNTFKDIRKNVKIDGFRKGSISKEMYIKKFGIESLYKDAVDVAINSAYEKALNESELNPVCQPSVDIKKIDENQVEFNAIQFETNAKLDSLIIQNRNLYINQVAMIKMQTQFLKDQKQYLRFFWA